MGNTVTASSAPITIGIGANPGSGALGGTIATSASSGVATYSDLTINRPGVGYTLTASSSGLTAATSNPFNVNNPVGKDLVIEAISLSPPTVQPGGAVGVSYSVVNRGTLVVTETYTEKIYLSSDGTLDGSDTLLKTTAAHTDDLNSNGILAGSENVTIPGGTSTGNYFILVQADALGAVAEAVEGNNVIAKPLSVSPSPPNITNLSPPSGAALTSVTISGTNFGATQGTSTVTFNGATASPTSWGSASITTLAPAAAKTGPVVVTVGGQASNSVTFTVTALPDLVVSGVSNPPAALNAGASFDVTDTTANNGSATAAASTTRYRLSLDATITPADPLLTGIRTVPSLTPSNSSQSTVSVTIPNNLAPGQYYLAACADDTSGVTESNEANNCILSTVAAQVNTVGDRGLAWLISNQQTDGSWKSVSGTEFAATAAAIEAFEDVGLRSFSYSRGVSWLTNATAPSVDSLARQISALSRAQFNVSSYLVQLEKWRNSSTAWGAYEGFETTYPDTPLALSAVRIGGLSYSDVELQNGLCAIFNGDSTSTGSWSFVPASSGPGSTSNKSVLPTSYNISEINAIKLARGWTSQTCASGSFTLQTVIDNGIDWLLTQRQKADGGFSDSANSTVIETALAYILLRDLRPNDAATNAALTYLVNSQGSDGSWNGDALQTALVLRALPPPGYPYNDADGDGVPDTIEIILGTNPSVADSRGLLESGMAMASAGPLIMLSNQTDSNQDREESSLQADGDLTLDAIVDAADAALAERIALGLAIPSSTQLVHGDVSPSGSPDGVIDLNDVERIRRKIVGAENF